MQVLIIQAAILFVFAVFPLSTESLNFWQIRSPIEIKIQKNSPPYQAFKMISGPEKTAENLDNSHKNTEFLSTESTKLSAVQSAQKIVLLEPVVVKKFQVVPTQTQKPKAVSLTPDWVASLPIQQRVRVEKAQSQHGIFSDDAGASPISVVKNQIGYTLNGPIEISGGLALTDQHFIDLRRSVEGSPREAGEVSIKDGTYKIQIDTLSGSLIAKMYNKSGQVLGEGTLRLAGYFSETGKAPKLIIKPQERSWAGKVSSAYGKPAEGLRGSIFNGEKEFEKSEDGQLSANNLAAASVSVGRFEAPQFVPSNTILMAGQNFETPIFPMSMVKALKEIVSEQLAYDLNSPELPVIWGQVLVDGKAVSGATVEVESAPGLKTIYFDAFNLPDSNLKETSTSGYYAIIGAPEGLHALIAKKGENYFSHNIAIVEAGTVSLTNLESSLKTHEVPIRAFEAFSGAPQSVEIEMQSLEAPLRINESGLAVLLLPEVARMSLLDTIPSPGYLPARYIYHDNQEFIHVPLVSEKWLLEILQEKWTRIDSNKGTIIGFVPHEGFEVYLAGLEEFSVDTITYFDSNGAKAEQGVAGGGFIVNNLDLDVHEVVIFGKDSEKFFSKIVPVDEKSVTVLNFQEN